MMDEQRKFFSRNLSEFVSQSGKQQKEIAEELNVNQKTFNGWCNGLSIPKTSIIRKLTDYFNTDIDSFIEPTKGKGILGKRIKEARKRKGFTQEELAKVLGIATGTVQQYELGKRQPRVEYLERIAEALDIKVRDLLNSDSSLDGPRRLKMAFKDRLREARKKLGLTQTEIAEKIGVAKSTYAGYETGNSEPNIHLTSLIMDCLKVDANFLWQDSIKKELQEDSKETALDRIADALERIADALEDGIGGES